MRYALMVGLLIVMGIAMAEVQTLENIGISPLVGPVEQNKSWVIPYAFEGNCTPFFSIKLISGMVRVYDGNRLILETKRPGTYRLILREEGLLRIILERLPGEGDARIDPTSFLACDRVPVVEVNRLVPGIWNVGGFTPVRIVLRNRGTAEAQGVIVLQNPYNAAPQDPLPPVTIPAGTEINVDVIMLTVREDSKVLFPKLCLQYADKYGTSEACTESTTFRAELNVPLACIERSGAVEVFNRGYLPTEVGGARLLPRDSQMLGLQAEKELQRCAIRLKIEKGVFEENEDRDVYISMILALLGLLGIVASEKRLKTRKA